MALFTHLNVDRLQFDSLIQQLIFVVTVCQGGQVRCAECCCGLGGGTHAQEVVPPDALVLRRFGHLYV